MLNWKCINKKTQDFRPGFLSGASRSPSKWATEDMITLKKLFKVFLSHLLICFTL